MKTHDPLALLRAEGDEADIVPATRDSHLDVEVQPRKAPGEGACALVPEDG